MSMGPTVSHGGARMGAGRPTGALNKATKEQGALANLNRRCIARARSTGNQCLNPAAFGCLSFRVHGSWKGAKTRVGKAHPQYKHGERT